MRRHRMINGSAHAGPHTAGPPPEMRTAAPTNAGAAATDAVLRLRTAIINKCCEAHALGFEHSTNFKIAAVRLLD